MPEQASGSDWLKKKVAEGKGLPKPELPPSSEVGSNQVESWIRGFGVDYAGPVTLKLSDIDRKRSRANQARSEAIIPDSVERYTVALKKGDQFPPIVVYPAGSKSVIIDGNNREAAYQKAGIDKIQAFVIDPDTPSETITLMTISANTHHGVTPPKSWLLAQAFHLKEVGLALEDAAQAANVSASSLREYQRMVLADKRARELKVQGFSALPQTVKTRLGALPSNPVFVEAAQVAIDTGMFISDVDELSRQIKARRTEGEQRSVIAAVRKQRESEARAQASVDKRRPISSAKTTLLTGLGKLLHTTPEEVVRQLLTDADRKEVRQRCERVAEVLLDIMTAIDQTDEEAARDAS